MKEKTLLVVVYTVAAVIGGATVKGLDFLGRKIAERKFAKGMQEFFGGLEEAMEQAEKEMAEKSAKKANKEAVETE